METSTKERLTGALILVAALVILVPEMLSGPGGSKGETTAQDPEAGPPLRTYDMSLEAGSAATATVAPQETLTPAASNEVAAVPPPVTQTAPPPVPEPQVVAPVAQEAPAPMVAKAEAQKEEPQKAGPKAEAKPVAKDAKPAATGKWWVQVGVFASGDNAQRLARELGAAGFPVAVSQIQAQGKPMHRVRAGPVADRAAAVALQARLAAKGHKASLVAP